MSEARRPGRPKASEGGIGRGAIIDGTITILRGGKLVLTRTEVASFLKITPALIGYYFPKGESLLVAAVSKQADLWLARMNEVVSADWDAEGLLDQLQGLVISMYACDRHIIDLHEQLWLDRQVGFSLIASMKKQMEDALSLVLDGADGACPRMLGYVVWGACEAYARDEHRVLAAQIINSGMLLKGRFGLAQRALIGRSGEDRKTSREAESCCST